MKSPRRQCRNSTKRRRHRRDRQPPQLRHRKLILETLEDRRLLAELLDIVGFKWIDLDDDGRHDLNEPGFPEVTIYLDSDNNGQLDPGEISVVTQDDDPATPEDETGRYQFTGMEEAIYRVREVVPSDSEPTSPRHDGNEEVVNLNSRQSAQPPTVAIAVDGRYGDAYQDHFVN